MLENIVQTIKMKLDVLLVYQDIMLKMVNVIMLENIVHQLKMKLDALLVYQDIMLKMVNVIMHKEIYFIKI